MISGRAASLPVKYRFRIGYQGRAKASDTSLAYPDIRKSTPPWNTSPYNENYFFSLLFHRAPTSRQHAAQCQLRGIAGASSVGGVFRQSRQSGHLFELSRPAAIGPGSPACGPFEEDTTYTTAAGQAVHGSRAGLG
jgi:hypothetical protein